MMEECIKQRSLIYEKRRRWRSEISHMIGHYPNKPPRHAECIGISKEIFHHNALSILPLIRLLLLFPSM